MRYVTEPEQHIPVVREVDVAVAGSGTSGLFAALAAAEQGVKTLLIDRFGRLGGNLGPAGFMLSTFGPEPTKTHHVSEYPGVCRAFLERLQAKLDPALHCPAADARRSPGFEYPSFSHAISWLAIEMAEELGLETMLSAYAGNPIMEDGVVRGVFVETKSGRVAVRAKVVIDATGDASLAERAGAPMNHGSASPERGARLKMWKGWIDPRYPTWNDTGLMMLVAGVGVGRYDAFRTQEVTLSEADEAFREELRSLHSGGHEDALIPLLREARESGGYAVRRHLPGNWFAALSSGLSQLECGLVQMYIAIGGEFDLADWEDVSRVETAARRQAYESIAFYRARVPGFENARVLHVSEYLGGRASAGIVGEYVVTFDDFADAARFDDVLFRNFVPRFGDKGDPSGCDMPYRMLLPQGIDGLLVAARGASFERRGHDSPARPRCSMMMLGEAAGHAAAMAVATGVPPRDLPVRALQRVLLDEGFFLGEPERLKALGLDKGDRP